MTTGEGIMGGAGCWGHERAWGLGHTQRTCPLTDMGLRCREKILSDGLGAERQGEDSEREADSEEGTEL